MIPLLLAAALGLANPVIQNHGNPPTRVLVNQTPKKQAIVTITYVKSAWYVNKPLLKRGFRKAIPTYKVIDGLDEKYFTWLGNNTAFGGIYFWASKEKAEKWFSPQWFETVEKKRGTVGQVTWFKLKDRWISADFSVEKGAIVITLSPKQLTKQVEGLLGEASVENLLGETRYIHFWQNTEMAEKALQTVAGTNPDYVFFNSPRAIINNHKGGNQ